MKPPVIGRHYLIKVKAGEEVLEGPVEGFFTVIYRRGDSYLVVDKLFKGQRIDSSLVVKRKEMPDE